MFRVLLSMIQKETHTVANIHLKQIKVKEI